MTISAFVFVNARSFVKSFIVSPSRSNASFEKSSLSILFGIKYGLLEFSIVTEGNF